MLVNPTTHSEEEIQAVQKRFRDHYVAELSMVEAPEVEGMMVRLAELVDKEVTQFTPAQNAAYKLSHVLRDSFVSSWQIPSSKTK